jgi:rubrerythrin
MGKNRSFYFQRGEEKEMVKIFDYACKKCWHTWRDKRKFEKCPRCGSTNIDKKEDILLSE